MPKRQKSSPRRRLSRSMSVVAVTGEAEARVVQARRVARRVATIEEERIAGSELGEECGICQRSWRETVAGRENRTEEGKRRKAEARWQGSVAWQTPRLNVLGIIFEKEKTAAGLRPAIPRVSSCPKNPSDNPRPS